MRIDKYLWCTRYFKTRTLASEACKKKHVKINGANAKPAKEVFGGEKIKVRKNQIDYELIVLDIPKNRVGAKIVDLYRKDITPEEAFDNQEFVKFAKDYYRKKGIGRPTKKDRRDLEDYLNNSDESERS
jgi:ribosome-associated heat shock protein Hsp15